MMTDLEMITRYQTEMDNNIANWPVEIYHNDLERLLTLARAGTAVQPRPISEADRGFPILNENGPRLLLRNGDEFVLGSYRNAMWRDGYGHSAFGMQNPECFYDLSALPPVQIDTDLIPSAERLFAAITVASSPAPSKVSSQFEVDGASQDFYDADGSDTPSTAVKVDEP